ncbi:uncharacterized protein L201_006699 [Kwoniella dendrophila CBS 6074]|uniref:Uncharacterized protein n=1 Tax=Kwoniella dendrophila CBS 6074 TaxID=1295534 RepID=A0AAX4K4I4_9TREE
MASKQPVKPIKLEPNQVYLHVSYSSTEPPTKVTQDGLQAKFLGQIGELQGEGIYQIQSSQGIPVKRDEESWTNKQNDFVDMMKRNEGIDNVKIMDEPKQRGKRDEF